MKQAQKQLCRNRELASRNAKNEYLLRGHVSCRRCGRSYWGNVSHSHRYYGCSGNLKIVTPIKCDNRRISANILEEIVWEQVAKILAKPDLVMAEMKRRQQEAVEVTSIEQDLERVERQLANREDQKARTWKAFEITGDEKTFKASIAKLGEEVRALEEEKLRLEKRIEVCGQFKLDFRDIRRACNIVKRNLRGITFEDKRLALEALQVKVWVDGTAIAIEGAIPMGDIRNTTSTGYAPRQQPPPALASHAPAPLYGSGRSPTSPPGQHSPSHYLGGNWG